MEKNSEQFYSTWVTPVYEQDSKQGLRSRKDLYQNQKRQSGDIADGRKRIAVIGAGISGLCSLKHLLDKAHFSPVVFEQNSRVGGTWYYTRDANRPDGTVSHSAVYGSLMINSPKQLMTFPGFPHDRKGDSYLHHTQVLEYIEKFTDFYQLEPYIKIFMGHRHEAITTRMPSNVLQRPNVSHLAEGNKVVFLDGSQAEIDSIILCTGYSYDFPFLTDDVIQLRKERVTPLYKHLVHIKYPNLLFVGLSKCVTYFPHLHEQARAAVSILEGDVKLPSEQEMLNDAEQDFRQKLKEFNLTELHAHYVGRGYLQWRLNEDHANLCGFDKLPKVLADMLCSVRNSRSADFGTFRKINYFFKDSDSFGIRKQFVLIHLNNNDDIQFNNNNEL